MTNQLTPVEEIREAARLMRQRAEAMQAFWGTRRAGGWGYPALVEEFVSSWLDATFEVANWLADVATDLDEDLWPDGHDVPRNALAVARAFLGGAS